MRCHGVGALGTGALPDLRRLDAARHAQFEAIVLGGALQPLGMPRFDDVLDARDAAAIQHYVLAIADQHWADATTERGWLDDLLDTVQAALVDLVDWAI